MFVFREYAAYVQRRTETFGVVVNLVPLGASMTPTEVLDAAARRGLLYVVVITPQHEAHRSVTLTILHGRNPQGKRPKGRWGLAATRRQAGLAVFTYTCFIF